MKVGDLILFVNTGCHGVVTQTIDGDDAGHPWVYVLNSPDADGLCLDEPTAFPAAYLVRVAEVINESR